MKAVAWLCLIIKDTYDNFMVTVTAANMYSYDKKNST